MSDQQPLLMNTRNVSGDDDDDDDAGDKNKQISKSASILSDWRQCFGGNKSNEEYTKFDDTIPSDENGSPASIVDLFRFANGFDYLVMVIGFFLIAIHSVCILANMVTFGRLTGVFIGESFSRNCQPQFNSTSVTSYSNIGCPLGIELNSVNYAQFHKLCSMSDKISSSTSIPTSSTFRMTVMNKVYWLFFFGTVASLCAFIENLIWTCSTKGQIARMKICLFRSLIQRNISYMDSNVASELNDKLFANTEKIKQGIGFEFLIAFATLFTIVASLTISFAISWQLTLIMLCFIPVVIGVSIVFAKLTAKETVNELNSYSKAGQVVQEVFSSLRTVLSLNGSKFEQSRYDKELEPTRWSSIRKSAVFGIFMGWLSLVTYIVYSVGFISGSLFMSYGNHNKLNISDIIVVVSIFAQSMAFFSFIGPFFQSFSSARGAAVPVLNLIDEANQRNLNDSDIFEENTLNTASPNMNGDIEFNNVNFVYPTREDVTVLHNLNIIARVGQTTALVGSSGCGKSTCISLLLRYYQPSSGDITIDGQSITNHHLEQYRQNIGVVSQEPILFGMTIYENIRLGKINATRQEIEEAARQANAHHFIMKLPEKYETLVGERGIQLSGGEKQRVALARALVKQPTILLLDEATSALDNISERLVQEALDRACKNRTTIVIAHRLNTIQNADYIYVFDHGSIIEQGTHEMLMKTEGSKYETMVKHQQLIKIEEDEKKNISQIIKDDEHQIYARTRLFSETHEDDLNQGHLKKSEEKSAFLRLLLMNRSEFVTLSIGCIACLFDGAGQPVFAILLSKIVNTFQNCSDQHKKMLEYCCFFLALGLLLLILRFLQYTAFGISGSKLIQRIRSKAFKCLLRQEVAYFDQPENNSGAICARLSTEASALQEMIGTRLGVICEGFALTFFGLIFGLFFSWQLTIIIGIPMIIFATLISVEIRSNGWTGKKSDLINEKANTLSMEVIQNLRTIKQLSVEKEILRQYSNLMNEELLHSQKACIIPAVVYGVYWGLDIFTTACLYWRALVLVERNELQTNSIVMVFSFAIFSIEAIRTIGFMSQTISASLSAAKNFFRLFDRIPKIDNTSTDGQTLIDFRGDIEFNQVKFAYPLRPASTVLNKFRLNIKSGQRVALVGASGCGKSTIVQLLERFYDVGSGKLFIDGIDIRHLNIQWIRSRIGLVSQEPVLFDLTIAENISYGLENIPMDEIMTAATKANIHQFIQQLPQGYETKVGTKGSFLSGGEKQRIAIARALLRKPKILLLDEATSAMDSYNEQIVQEALDQAQREDLSRTSLIIAHRLSTIQSCDLICVLDKGYIIECGTHTDLTQQRGAYYRMIAQNNL